jgi:hypothetical protein
LPWDLPLFAAASAFSLQAEKAKGRDKKRQREGIANTLSNLAAWCSSLAILKGVY